MKSSCAFIEVENEGRDFFVTSVLNYFYFIFDVKKNRSYFPSHHGVQ
jgi:hypothetical protein